MMLRMYSKSDQLVIYFWSTAPINWFSSGMMISSFALQQYIGESSSLNWRKLWGLMLMQIYMILSMYSSFTVRA